MEIKGTPWMGHFNQRESSIRRSLGQHARHNAHIKIGATSNPTQRWQAHRGENWKEMILLWETTSYRDIKYAEKQLIEWAKGYDRIDSWNERDGGAGLNKDADSYFIYVLLE